MISLAFFTTALACLALTLALWLGCYIVVRSPRSRLAWLAAFTLWSLSGVVFDIVVTLQPSRYTTWWPGWPLTIPIAIWYHLSLQTLPPRLAQPQRRWLGLIYLAAGMVDLLLGETSWLVVEARHGLGEFMRIYSPGPLFILMPVVLVGLSVWMLANFWRARRAAAQPIFRHQLDSLLRGTALEVFAVLYGMLGVFFRWPLPTWPILLALTGAVISLGYGIVRYSALIDGRILRYDFILSGALIAAVVSFYLVIMAASPMPLALQALLVGAIIFTHSVSDLARRELDSLFLQRPERILRTALHTAAIEVGERAVLEDGLRATLSAIAETLDARWGLIALEGSTGPIVRASFRSLAVGEVLPFKFNGLGELAGPPVVVPERLEGLTLIAPLVADNQSWGAILLGPPGSGAAYGEHDLDLISGAADTLADLLRDIHRQEDYAAQLAQVLDAYRTRERELQLEIESLRHPNGTSGPVPEQTAQVEAALQHMSDYSFLGENLPPFVRIPCQPSEPRTHLERGKIWHDLLIACIEKLRPDGTEPRELPTREWHAYFILRDAYVQGEANRDIMSRLYISEATFHRTRRRALHALTKALIEIEAAPA